MIAGHRAQGIANIVCSLIENTRSGGTDVLKVYRAETLDVILWESEWCLRVARHFVPQPTRHVESCFMQPRRTECMVPKNGCIFVGSVVVPQIGRADRPVIANRRNRN